MNNPTRARRDPDTPGQAHRPEQADETGQAPDDPAAPGTAPAEAERADGGVPWRRLDNRLLLVQLKWLVPPALSTGFYALITLGRLDREAYIRLGLLAGVFLLIMLWRLVELLTTHYRVAGDILEVRTGLLGRRRRTVPCDRIRGIDLTADPFLRVFGLVTVKITTAQGGGEQGDTSLEALRAADAEELRQTLLRRAEAAPGKADPDRLIARMDWAWLRYMPLNSWGVLAVLVVGASALRILDGFGIKPERTLRAVLGFLGAAGLWESIVLGTLALLVVGSVTAVALAAEEWWGYRLERDESDNFAVHRGLLTTRSLSIDARRMRGVEVTEPLALRLGGGAHVAAVATGLQKTEDLEVSKMRTLSPGVPRARAHEIAAAVVGEHPSPTTAALRPHPRAALRRRHVRAALTVLAPCAGLALLGLLLTPVLLHIAWISAAVLLPAGALFAHSGYRALGHALHGRHLLTRYGTFIRRTVALRRDSVVGWVIVQSPAQRRSGLATVRVTTSACKSGAYPVRDVNLAEGLVFADEAVPGLLTPFLERG
ncbi:PH domain-containing protein [Streptomyces sp. NPDC001700]